MRLLLLFCGLALPRWVAAQADTWNQIYDNNIHTVLLNPDAPLPVVDLKSGRITLQFDHLGYDLKNYVYTIQHCNADWQPSSLQDNEYIDGYLEDRILNISNSLNTLQPYTHYAVSIPNSNMKWSKSGNYVLKIFDDDNDHQLVLTRRFLVQESQWLVRAKMSPVINANKLFTHQEVDYEVFHPGASVANPVKEVKTYVLQNYRWETALGPVAPRPFSAASETMDFNYQDSIVFPAGKEWRFFDLRNFDYRGANVRSIQRTNNNTLQVWLKSDQDRSESHSYGLVDDLNGQFYIENRTQGQDIRQADYARVGFILERNAEFEDDDVYVFGQLSDWLLKPEFKMEYDPVEHYYYCNPLLKQGYYNYEYLTVNRETYNPDPEGDLEGNWHETGNYYTVLVYYRPVNSRYDRLMTVGSVDSRVRK